uniref:CSON009249 protein n=1 Tax=Culicoides sonorensis TaxID=179676 RepID=A0A336M2F6_CULSO
MKSISIFLVAFLILNTQIKWISALIFMRDIAVGVLFALAVPLPSDDPYLSNVFMSFNFESNYACPVSAADVTNLYFDKFQLPYDNVDPELDDYRRRPLQGRKRSISSDFMHVNPNATANFIFEQN